MLKNKNPLTELSFVNVGTDAPSPLELPEGNVVLLEKRRTSVDLSSRSQEELNWLCEAAGSNRKTDVIRMSLYLYWLLAGMEDQNQAVIIRDNDGQNALFVPSLTAINSVLRASDKAGRVRLTLELSARALKELDELRSYAGENKKADVIRQAIHIHYTLLFEVQKGRTVIIRDPSGSEFDLFVPKAEQLDHLNEPISIHSALST